MREALTVQAQECSVAAVVLNWNGWRDTLECLASVLNAERVPDVVVVCDNGSADGSLEHIRGWVRERGLEERISLIDIGVNLGFAGGNNVGIAFALERGVDFVWILNNDVVVHATTLSRMLSLLWRSPSAGAVAPVFLSYRD
ncbi:MAG TPA: glycosyltransferase family 2 protein, partial [Candidatus Baltobacteraceae bacterium]|nr:glycosyltransferase family 2 protein [Candidatus Baltobacteraceae bacterium]